MQKYCIYCAESLDERAVFCHACGKRQPNSTEISSQSESSVILQQLSHDNSELQDEAEENKSKKQKKNFIVNLVRNSILLAVAITIFALSFAPIFNWKFKDFFGNKLTDEDFNFSVSHSAIDGIIYLFDSVKEYENESDSPLYDDMEDAYDDLFADVDIDNLSTREKKKVEENLERIMLLGYRLDLQTESTKTNVSHITIAIISLLYILITFVFLVFSILNFICSFGLMKNKRKSFYNVAMSLLCAIPAFVLITYTAFFAYMSNVGNEVIMGSGAIAIFVVSLITIVALLTLSFIFDCRKAKVSNIVLRSVSSVLSILVICMCFTPIFTTSVRTIFEGRDNKSVGKIPVYFSLFEKFLLDESEIDSISNMQNYSEDGKKLHFTEQFELFGEYSKSDINNGLADDHNGQYLVEILAGSTEADISPAISVIGLLFLITVICAGLLLQQNLAYFTGCKYLHILARIAKILTLIFASLAFAASIAVFTGIGICVNALAPSGYAIGLGAGIFFLLVFAIAVCCIPTRIKTEN